MTIFSPKCSKVWKYCHALWCNFPTVIYFFSVKSFKRVYFSIYLLLLSKDSKIHEKTQLSIPKKYAIISGWCFKQKWLSWQKHASIFWTGMAGRFLLGAFLPSLGTSQNTCSNNQRWISTNRALTFGWIRCWSWCPFVHPWVRGEHEVISLPASHSSSLLGITLRCWETSDRQAWEAGENRWSCLHNNTGKMYKGK